MAGGEAAHYFHETQGVGDVALGGDFGHEEVGLDVHQQYGVLVRCLAGPSIPLNEVTSAG
jgi:hypothetical protein